MNAVARKPRWTRKKRNDDSVAGAGGKSNNDNWIILNPSAYLCRRIPNTCTAQGHESKRNSKTLF